MFYKASTITLIPASKDREEQYKYSFVVSMYELYCDGLRDLLNKKKVRRLHSSLLRVWFMIRNRVSKFQTL